MYRYILGNKVYLSADQTKTVEDVTEDRWERFSESYKFVIEHPSSNIFHIIYNWLFVHAASHSDMWDISINIHKEIKSRAIYGETTGLRDSAGMPERIYNWIDDIPSGKTVIVGHDRTAIFNRLMSHPIVVKNDVGGQVFFTDTGCGKGGHLSGTILRFSDNDLQFDRFVSFKEPTWTK
jgi:hypothetical protein